MIFIKRLKRLITKAGSVRYCNAWKHLKAAETLRSIKFHKRMISVKVYSMPTKDHLVRASLVDSLFRRRSKRSFTRTGSCGKAKVLQKSFDARVLRSSVGMFLTPWASDMPWSASTDLVHAEKLEKTFQSHLHNISTQLRNTATSKLKYSRFCIIGFRLNAHFDSLGRKLVHRLFSI